MKEHVLKTWPEYYEKVRAKEKTFEVRANDRNFSEGDVLILREWNPVEVKYTGRSLQFKIGYILKGGQFGIQDGYVVLSLIKK